MNKILSLILASQLAAVTIVSAQDFKGKVVGPDGQPVADVMITSPGCTAVRTDADGAFTFTGLKQNAVVTFKHEGFFNKSQVVRRDNFGKDATIQLISDSKTRYNESAVLPLGTEQNNDAAIAGLSNVTRKDFALGTTSVDNAMRSNLSGIHVTNKSGMTGEGSFIQLHGLLSILGENMPLFVINGVPYLPDTQESMTISGYSRSIFQALNGQDIRNITVLKGSQCAIYGALAGNGVVMIETDQASKENMNTRISLNASYSANWNNSRVPLMNSTQYKSYLTDMGLTYYENQEAFFDKFTFLSNPNANNANLYAFNTNWQDQILQNSSTKDFLFRVEGGDNIAKYNISLGYTGDDGTLKNTNTDRYSAQINASVLVSRKVEILASVNTAYVKGNYMEQGLSYETNPLLTAYRRSPLLSAHSLDIYGNQISTYSTYQYGAIDDENMYVTNPTALIDEMEAMQKQYDLNAKVQLVWRPNRYTTVNGLVGLYYNYNKENVFIPGVTDQAVKYIFDQYGKAENSVRVGTNYTFNMYYGANGVFHKEFANRHDLKATLGFQATTTSYEYDASFGRNTPNDFYRTMSNVESQGRYFDGYNNDWTWMNVYANVDYIYNKYLKIGGTIALDGASSTSNGLTQVWGGGDIVLMLDKIPALCNTPWLNKLNLYTSYYSTGNSRFGTKNYSSYYTSTPYLTIAGIIRANLPTTDHLKSEKVSHVTLGMETSLLNNRISFGAEYYGDLAKDVIIPGSTSALLGTSTYYVNAARFFTHGVELKAAFVPVLTKDFSWTLGATFNTAYSEVTSMGNIGDVIYTINDVTSNTAQAQIIFRNGEEPYSFYGYQTAGVYSTTEEANSAYTDAAGNKTALVNDKGTAYQAGDVHYIDQNGDGRIDDNDRVCLGSATPKGSGNLFTRLQYKGIALDVDFGYQYGGKAYNAVRRITESASDFSNQSTAVQRRWSMEGQVTDIPRAEYGDPRGNNAFSDRWIESTDFIKLRTVTLSYTFDKSLLRFLQGGTVYVTGENLFTSTSYLGLDPEFSYSYNAMLQGVDYGKVNSPRSVKVGVNLKF